MVIGDPPRPRLSTDSRFDFFDFSFQPTSILSFLLIKAVNQIGLRILNIGEEAFLTLLACVDPLSINPGYDDGFNNWMRYIPSFDPNCPVNHLLEMNAYRESASDYSIRCFIFHASTGGEPVASQ